METLNTLTHRPLTILSQLKKIFPYQNKHRKQISDHVHQYHQITHHLKPAEKNIPLPKQPHKTPKV
jgi:hypothetical protein